MNESFDFGIIGGGVIGLSLAWKLSQRGRVIVVDRQEVGREASWAGAGILPPAVMDHAIHPREKLMALSFQLHADWAKELKRESGIDTGYRCCGSAVVARTSGELAALQGQILEWREDGISVDTLSANQLVQQLHNLKPIKDQILAAAFLPQECQIRNPSHLQALKQGCLNRGVKFLEEQGTCRLISTKNAISDVRTESGHRIQARRFAVTAGAWSAELVQPLGIPISTIPVRGQMLLYKLSQPTFSPVIYEGTRYIAPREDGHVLVGSTLEEAGFDKNTTEAGIKGLMDFAQGLVPELKPEYLANSWAGLRPASFDGFPYIGPAPQINNLWIGTAHFRSGLLLSTGTAEIMTRLLCDEAPPFDLAPFRVDRG